MLNIINSLLILNKQKNQQNNTAYNCHDFMYIVRNEKFVSGFQHSYLGGSPLEN